LLLKSLDLRLLLGKELLDTFDVLGGEALFFSLLLSGFLIRAA